MLGMLKPFLYPSKFATQFAIKLSLSSGLALFIAFCLDLKQPQWAAATAIIVAQPHAGMVISKGLARLVGTIGGTAMALLSTALFSQAPWLFIFALASWLVICTAASTIIRSSWAYSFMLAGYSTAIIVLPDIFKPLLTFDYAIARCTEISLGIICSSAVFALLWPVKVHHELAKEAFSTRLVGFDSACNALRGQAVNEVLLTSLSKIVAVDTQREHAAFEGGDGRNRAQAILAMCHHILGLLRAARGAIRQLKILPEESVSYLQPWVDQCIEHLNKPTYRSLVAFAKQLHEEGQNNKQLEERAVLLRLELAMRYAASVGLDLSAMRSGKIRKKVQEITKISYLSTHKSYSLGLFFGLRAGVAFTIAAFCWMLWGWPLSEASGSLMMVAVVCSIFANKENAAQISMSFFRGTIYAIVVAFFVSQVITPSWSGFPLLWLAIGVPLFFGGLGMVNPATMGTGMVFSINLLMLCRPDNHAFQSTETFLNQGIAMLLGILSATFAFNLVKINSSYWQGKYMRGAMLRDLQKLTQESFKESEAWFGGRMADRLILLARHKKVMAENAEQRWEDALYAMDMGDELLYIRSCLSKNKLLRKDLSRYLNTLGRVFENPPAPIHVEKINRASHRLKTAIIEKDKDYLAQLALPAINQLQQTWQNWCQNKQLIKEDSEETTAYGTA